MTGAAKIGHGARSWAVLALLLAGCHGALADETPSNPNSFWAKIPYPDGKACEVTFEGNVPNAAPGQPFTKMHIKDVTWSKANLAHADFRGAVLENVKFVGANLSGAKFDGAKLCDIDFDGADLSKASFEDAHIEHAGFHGAQGRGADFAKAIILASGFGKSDFRGGDFAGAFVVCANEMVESACWGEDRADFSGADLTGATVVGLGGAAMDGAKAEGGAFDTDAIPDLAKAAFTRVWLAPWELADRPAAPFGRDEILLMAATYGSLVPVTDLGPGFDCVRAATKIERTICSSAELAALDGALARAYAATQRQYPESADLAKTEQRAWLKTRDACAGDTDALSCLLENYRSRLAALLKHPGIPARLAPGRYLPAFSGAMVPSGIAGTPLAAKLATLETVTSDWLAVKDGNIESSAVGANGHTCSDAGKLVAVSGESGYRAGTDIDSPLYAGFGDVVVLLGGRNYCGARASWANVWRKAN